MEGFIKIHRKIMDTSIYFNSQAVHLFLHLLLKASFKERKVMFNNKIVELKAGEFITGRKKLAEETSISESKIYRLLDIFENENLIEQQPNSRYSIISIKNWSEYQEVEQQMNNKRTTNEQQVNTNKNDNKDKNNIIDRIENLDFKNALSTWIEYLESYHSMKIEEPQLMHHYKILKSFSEPLKVVEYSIGKTWKTLVNQKKEEQEYNKEDGWSL